LPVNQLRVFRAEILSFLRFETLLKFMQKPEALVMERTFNASPEKIWRAISDKNEMKNWYFELAEFKPEPGFEFQFDGGDEHKTYVHLCKVTEAVPNRKLAYTWRYEGFSGDSLVTFEIFLEGKKTRLKLTHEGIETFPESEPALARENFVAGWNHIIGTSLQEYLTEKTISEKA